VNAGEKILWPEYEALAERSGFDVIRHAANDAAAGGRTVWLCQRRG
jgi:hypothetical protein